MSVLKLMRDRYARAIPRASTARHILFTTLGVFALSTSVLAQAAPTDTLATVKVQGERPATEHLIERASAALDARAGATTLVRASDFERGRATTFSDLFAYAPGVLAQTRHGEEVRFSIRGSGIQRGFLMRGIALYQDGVPLGQGDGGGDFQAIDPLAVQYIEVWRGGNALEYGASTLGGAVNVVTPTGKSGSGTRLRIDGGAYGQRRAHVQLGGVAGAADGAMSLTRGKQDGWREHSASDSTRLAANVGLQLDDALEGRVFLNHVDASLDLPGSISRIAMARDPRQAAPNYARLNASNQYTLNRLATRLSWTPVPGRSLTASTWLSDRDRFHPMVFGILKQDSRDTGVDLRGVFDFAQDTPTRRLVFGASTSRYRGTEARFTNPDGRPGVPTGDNIVDARQQVLYAEYSHGIDAHLVLQAGVQAARAQRRLDNRTAPAAGYDRTFDAVNPKLGILYSPDSANRFHANVARSFEPSPFGEAPVRPLLPIPDPQKATTAEIGWRHQADALALEVTLYRAWIDDELLALTDATGTSIGTANADRTVHQGVELGARVPLGTQLALRGTYLWNDFYFDGDPIYGDNRIAGIAPHVLQAEIEWRPLPWLAIAPSVEWQPTGAWIDHANTVRQNGFTLLHLRLSGDLSDSLRWYADVRNVTDRRYVASTAVQADVRGRDGAYYFPGDPRSVYAGLEWRFR